MSDLRPRLTAALSGRYRIEHELGQGGMATVYLADDLKHSRKVALKVLKPELAAVIGAERFLSEIKTTANLQHPHILPLFDSGEVDGFLFYVMPYVEGESLRSKIDRERQLGVEDAVRITRAVASALQYAHDRDVIHRDIKPENILIHAGEPVVADFGIALALSEAGDGRLTETGLSLGTPHYMSPEQATADRDLTNRSDVYALGCVLYEMLTGDPPHTGPTPQSVLVRILTESPRPVTDVRASVPPHVVGALAKALEKLPADRFADAAGFAAALDDRAFQYSAALRAPGTGALQAGAAGGGVTAGPTTRWVPALGGAVGGALTLALALTAWGWLRPPAPPTLEPATRAILNISDIEIFPFDQVIISPDGSRFAVTGTLNGQRGLFVRNADEERFRLLPGPDEPLYPDFSPDGAWIVYTENSDDSLMKVALSGGAPRVLIPESADLNPAFPDWADDGTILFVGAPGSPGLYRVPDTGGEATLIAEGEYFNPRLLPGGFGVLVTDRASTSTRYLDLAVDTISDLIPGGIDARYIATSQAMGQALSETSVDATGHILYADVSGGLWALPFDVAEGVARGQAVPVLDGITTNFDLFARYDVSANGTLVYGSGGGSTGGPPRDELLVVTLTGDETVLPLAPRLFNFLRWSPDGASVAYAGNEPGAVFSQSIYVYDVDLGTTPRRLTFGDSDFRPIWSPDGSHIAFGSVREGTNEPDLWVKAVVDDTPPEALLARPDQQAPFQWLTGDLLLFGSRAGRTADLWTVQPSDNASAAPYLTSESDLNDLAVAPAGDLAAYTSDESDTREVYVRSFPTPRQPVIVSQGGGTLPRWSPDGSTIYYWKSSSRADSLFAAHVTREPTFAVQSTEFVLAGDYITFSWDLHPDGDRFVVPRNVRDAEAGDSDDAGGTEGTADADPERHFVVVNWFTELRAALGGG